MLRGSALDQGRSEPGPASSTIRSPKGAPADRASRGAPQDALLLFLGRDHSLVRRSVGFAWTLDRLRCNAQHHLTPAQLEELRPLVQRLVEDARAEQESILGLRAVLTPEQVAFLNDTTGLHSGDSGPDVLPSESFERLLTALQARATGPEASSPRSPEGSSEVGQAGVFLVSPVPGDEAGVCVPSAPGRDSAPALVSRWSDFLERPPQLARWLLVMDGRNGLAFSADQARQMLPLLKRLIAAVERYDATAVQFAAALTAEQVAYLRSEFLKRGIPDFVVVNFLLELLPPR